MKTTPLRVPYTLSVHGREEAAAVAKVITEHRTGLGKETSLFEKKISALFGKKYGVMVNSGSSANLLAFEILNLPPGSEVITPVLTFNTTVAPIIQKQLVPVFVDVKKNTYLVDIDQLEKKITSKTRALMIPSLIGNVPDMKRLRAIADKYKLFFVEDSCDTLGARYYGKSSGVYSDISTTSFYGSHVINAGGGGGLIAVNKPHWYKQLLVLRGWGRSSSLFSESEDMSVRFAAKLAGIPYDGKFIFTEVGYNFLPLEMGAAFGLVQLKKLPQFSRRRQQNFNALRQFFSRYQDFFDLPVEIPGIKTNWLAFPLCIKNGAPFSRLKLVTFLEKNNIQTRPIFTGNILRQPVLTRNKISFGVKYISLEHPVVAKLAIASQKTEFPIADTIMKNAFLIGCHQGIGPIHLTHIKKVIATFIRMYGQISHII